MLQFRCEVNLVKGNRFNFITAISIISRQKALNSINKNTNKSFSKRETNSNFKKRKSVNTASSARVRFYCNIEESS